MQGADRICKTRPSRTGRRGALWQQEEAADITNTATRRCRTSRPCRHLLLLERDCRLAAPGCSPLVAPPQHLEQHQRKIRRGHRASQTPLTL